MVVRDALPDHDTFLGSGLAELRRICFEHFPMVCVNAIILFVERSNNENFLISRKDLVMCVILESLE